MADARADPAYKGPGGIGMWQREGPLDFQRRVQMRVGGWPEKD